MANANDKTTAPAQTRAGAPAVAKAAVAAVLIHNTKDSLHSLSLPAAGGDPRRAIALHKTHLLKPGVNRVPADVWRTAKEQVMTQKHLEAGDLVELDKSTDVAKMPEKAALKIVSETVDRDLLTEWKSGEKRPKVKAALKSQLAKLEPEDDDDDE